MNVPKYISSGKILPANSMNTTVIIMSGAHQLMVSRLLPMLCVVQFFIMAEYLDFPDVRIHEAIKDGVSEGTCAAGNQ